MQATSLGSLHPHDERGLWFARALTALYLALVTHVSLVPADFGVSGRQFTWHLVGMVLSLAPHHLLRMTLHELLDFAVNVLLYVPLGLLLPWTQRSPRRRGAAAGALISLVFEVLQAATRDRTASLLDVAANGGGHAAGYAVAYWLIRERRVTHSILVGGKGADAFAHLAGALRSTYLTALLVLSLFPYDVTVSAGRIWSKALGDGSEPGRIYPFLLTPWNASRLSGLFLALGLSAVFGALSWLAAHDSARPSASRLALQGLLVAGVIEAGQLVVASRTSDVAQLLAGAPGAVLGAWLVRRWTGGTREGPGKPADVVRAGLLLAAALWTLAVWTEAWAPFELESTWKQAGRKLVFATHWLAPAAFDRPDSITGWQGPGLELGLYIPLGLLLGAWADRSPRPLRWAYRRVAPAVAVAMLGCALELSQCLISGRTVDLGDAILHAAGGAIGLALLPLLSLRRPGASTPAS
jgi:glycopeptide antibiotics resistance protein